ncbi:hypothetical protein MMC30_000565 [Trapelia coarctata]|nr:hypothetical protein [Trapelia coarctata]
MANTKAEMVHHLKRVDNTNNVNQGTIRLDDGKVSGTENALESGKEDNTRDGISFLDLAFELRAKIYQEVVSQDPDDPPFELRAPTYYEVLLYNSEELPSRRPTRGNRSGRSGRRITRSIDGLVLVNRQVGAEAKAAYYERKSLQVELRWNRLYGRSPFFEYGVWGNLRPDLHFAQHCKIGIRLPLWQEDLLRPIKTLLEGSNSSAQMATGAASVKTTAKELNPCLKTLKIMIHGTGNRVAPATRAPSARPTTQGMSACLRSLGIMDYETGNPTAPRRSDLEADLRKRILYATHRDVHSEIFTYNANKIFASEKQLGQIVAAFTTRLSKQTLVEVELWNEEGKMEIPLSLPPADPVSTDALNEFWAALEL